jgi:hypothetical protein
VIGFRGYLEVMTVLEEEYTGATDLDAHPLFNPIVLAIKKKMQGSHPGKLSSCWIETPIFEYYYIS